MMPSQRRTRIFEELRNRGSVRVVELADLFSVSEMTVRRDLDLMQESGLLVKVHGGAVVSDKSAEEPGFRSKFCRWPARRGLLQGRR